MGTQIGYHKKNPDIGARPSVVLGAYCVDVNCKFPQVCCRCMLQNVASEVGGEAKKSSGKQTN